VRGSADKAKAPARPDNFQIEVEVPEGFDAEHLKGVEQVVHRCLIHHTLLQPPTITIKVKTPILA